jgi:hypothetical protein
MTCSESTDSPRAAGGWGAILRAQHFSGSEPTGTPVASAKATVGGTYGSFCSDGGLRVPSVVNLWR